MVFAAGVAGCGGDDDPVEGGALGLTEWLPRDWESYAAIDIAAFKDELDLDEDADPTTAPELEQLTALHFDVLRTGLGDSGEVLEAVEPASVTAAAISGSVDGRERRRIAAFATTGDLGEVGSRLGDLGYREVDGVLEGAAGEPAIRLEDGIVFASEDPDALRMIPDEQRDDPPAELLGELDGDDLAVYRVEARCYAETGAGVGVDGDTELGVLVPGGAEAEGMTPDTGEVGEADADGDVVVKPVIDPAAGAGALQQLQRYFPGYDCGE
jgi:hypothetical protein